jgi:hypothetical protein
MRVAKGLFAAMTKTVIALLSLAMLTGAASAQQPPFYSCEVSGSYKLEGGDLRPSATSNWKGGKTNGQRFQVNIQTGAMIGDGFSSSRWARTVVLDSGMSPRGSDYKVLYSSPPGGEFINVAYLKITAGSEPNKSFIFLDAGEVFTGLCHGQH